MRGPVVRKLEGTERLVAIGNAHFNANFNVVAMLELEGTTTLSAVQAAVQRVQRQHGCLQVEVTDDAALGWVFRHSSEPARVESVATDDDEGWRVVWERFAHRPLYGLAFRVAWVHGGPSGHSQLVAVFHHAISDIRSLSLFFDGVLASLHAEHTGVVPTLAKRALHAPLAQLARGNASPRSIGKVAWHLLVRRVRTVPLDAPKHVPVPDRRWAGSFRSLPPAAVESLVKRCRERDLTVGHVLSAAALLEVAARIRALKGIGAPYLSLNTSYDMRRYAPHAVDENQMGLLATAVQTYYQARPDDSLWSLAQRVKEELATSLARQEHGNLPIAVGLLGKTTGHWLARYRHGRPAEGALVVSNFGRLEKIAHGSFAARRIYFTAAQPAFGATLLLACGTLNGSMFLHLGHPAPAIAPAVGEAMLEGIIARAFGAVTAGDAGALETAVDDISRKAG